MFITSHRLIVVLHHICLIALFHPQAGTVRELLQTLFINFNSLFALPHMIEGITCNNV